MKRSKAIPISEIIKEYIKKENLDKGLLESRVVNSWEEIIGKTVARATTHVSINNGVMYVKVNSSVMRNELLMIRSKIITVINKHVGQEVVRDLVIQ